MKRTIDIELELQPMIDKIPVPSEQLWEKACSGDRLTIDTWRDTWIKNYQHTKDRFKELGDYSYGQLFGINRYKPAIVCGSGPSLKTSIPALKRNREQPNPVMTVSALHNFGYFEDENCHADYYMTLDAGPIVVDDVYEGRQKAPEEYWAASKDQTLIASACSPPELFELWQGKVYLLSILVPDMEVRDALNKIERLSHYISGGGNVTGGCIYAAKAVMGSGEIIAVGFDCCFDYDHKFHAYPTNYDNFNGNGIGKVIKWPDIFGIPRSTWPSYYNFKCWADWLTFNVPGRWASASEGIWGAYPEGNLSSIRYAPLAGLLKAYSIADVANLGEVDDSNNLKMNAVGTPTNLRLSLEEFFKDPKQGKDLVLF